MNEPLAFFITWTVYGTHLQGAEIGWWRREKGTQDTQPRLEKWRHERLSHPVLVLSQEQRMVVEEECRRHCQHRNWRPWAVNVRSNHCHVVVTAKGLSGSMVRDQLKANGTRGLRERWSDFQDRPVWTKGGDWKCIDSEEDLDIVCTYVRDAQDRKDRDRM